MDTGIKLELKDQKNEETAEITETEEIAEIKVFVNDKGMQITAFCPMEEGASDLSKASFQGTVGIQTQMGPIEVSFEFPPHYSLGKCFDEFETTAKEAVEEKMEEARNANKIVTPGDMGGQGLHVL